MANFKWEKANEQKTQSERDECAPLSRRKETETNNRLIESQSSLPAFGILFPPPESM